MGEGANDEETFSPIGLVPHSTRRGMILKPAWRVWRVSGDAPVAKMVRSPMPVNSFTTSCLSKALPSSANPAQHAGR